EIFGLGRTRLRQVLQRLAHERVVTLMPNRGAIVARPSVREAREVFAARRVIEAGVVQILLESAPSCPPSEHQDLLVALEKRQPRAVTLMLEHIDHVLADLRLEEPTAAHVD